MPRSNLASKVGALQHLVDTVPAADWQLWKASGPTKALLLQFEIDLEDLKEGWAYGSYVGEKSEKAQAQAAYLMGVPALIDSLVRGDQQDED